MVLLIMPPTVTYSPAGRAGGLEGGGQLLGGQLGVGILHSPFDRCDQVVDGGDPPVDRDSGGGQGGDGGILAPVARCTS